MSVYLKRKRRIKWHIISL